MTIDEKIEYKTQTQGNQRAKEVVGEAVYSVVEAILNITVVWPVETAVDCLDWLCYKKEGKY